MSVQRIPAGRPAVTSSPAEVQGTPREAAPRRGAARRTSGRDTDGPRAAAQTAAPAAATPVVGLNMLAAKFSGVVPPDPAGEAGPTQYVHTVNTITGARVVVVDKSTHVGSAFRMSGLAAAGACQQGLGDGVPYYDQFSGRWFLTEIAASDNALCVYISDDSDAIPDGTNYTGWEFDFTVFPDYPKWSVWQDALYLGFNNSGFSDPIFAFNKTAMIAGSMTTNDIVFDNPAALSAFGFQLLMPVDIDGTTPVVGPGIFVRHLDDEIHFPGFNDATKDFIEYFELDPNFITGTATVTNATIDVAEFDSTLCGTFTLSCIPQHGTRRRLDPLREPIMNRPVLRVGTTASTDQVFVGSFAVDVGHNRAGIRWFELHRPAATMSGGWTLLDEGTYAPSGLHRWVPSIDVNGDGDIALGFSGSSVRSFPSIRVTGRHAGDTPGQMTQAEVRLVRSVSPQTFATRWGDYSEMSVDPSDETTFWYTNEYLGRGGRWRTRILSFTLGP